MTKPLSAQQKKLAQAKALGLSDVAACKKARYKSKSSEAASNQVARMMSNDEYLAYYANLIEKTESDAVMSIKERKEWLTGGIKVPLSEVDSSSTYCVEEINTEGMTKIKKVDPIRAMDMLNKMDGAYAAEKVEVEHKGGVLVVPMADSLEEWEQHSIDEQEKLQADTINI
jgi:hypothetical protein